MTGAAYTHTHTHTQITIVCQIKLAQRESESVRLHTHTHTHVRAHLGAPNVAMHVRAMHRGVCVCAEIRLVALVAPCRLVVPVGLLAL